MIGHWPIETFGRPLWTRLSPHHRLSRLVASVRSDPPAQAPSPDRRLPSRSLLDGGAGNQFQFRNLSDDPYQSLKLDEVLGAPRRG